MLVRRYYRLKELTEQLLYITGEMTSDMMREANDIRHTLFGAFSPTQNVTHKLRTQLEKVRNASLFKYLLKD